MKVLSALVFAIVCVAVAGQCSFVTLDGVPQDIEFDATKAENTSEQAGFNFPCKPFTFTCAAGAIGPDATTTPAGIERAADDACGIKVPAFTDLLLGTTAGPDITIAMFYKIDTVTANNNLPIFSYGITSEEVPFANSKMCGLYSWIEPVVGTQTIFSEGWMRDGGAPDVIALQDSTRTITDGDWFHVAITGSTTEFKLYIDGTLTAGTEATRSLPTTATAPNLNAEYQGAPSNLCTSTDSHDFYLGLAPFSTQFHASDTDVYGVFQDYAINAPIGVHMDKVQVFTRVLTAAEILELANEISPSFSLTPSPSPSPVIMADDEEDFVDTGGFVAVMVLVSVGVVGAVAAAAFMFNGAKGAKGEKLVKEESKGVELDRKDTIENATATTS